MFMTFHLLQDIVLEAKSSTTKSTRRSNVQEALFFTRRVCVVIVGETRLGEVWRDDLIFGLLISLKDYTKSQPRFIANREDSFDFRTCRPAR